MHTTHVSPKSQESEIREAIAYLKPDLTGVTDIRPTRELSNDDSPAVCLLGNGLLVAYLIDKQAAFHYVQNKDLHRTGITENELHEIGIANLAKVAANSPLRIAPHRNVFAVLVDGNFESSMMLLDDLWENGFRQFVQGEYLAALPTRDVFAFCDASSQHGRKELSEVIARLKGTSDHPISNSLYRRVGKRWLPDAVS